MPRKPKDAPRTNYGVPGHPGHEDYPVIKALALERVREGWTALDIVAELKEHGADVARATVQRWAERAGLTFAAARTELPALALPLPVDAAGDSLDPSPPEPPPQGATLTQQRDYYQATSAYYQALSSRRLRIGNDAAARAYGATAAKWAAEARQFSKMLSVDDGSDYRFSKAEIEAGIEFWRAFMAELAGRHTLCVSCKKAIVAGELPEPK